MANLFRTINRFVRDIGSHLFYHFGLHCAQHQIRVILISCVVITSLIYPALAIYFSSQPILHFPSPLRWTLFDYNRPDSILNNRPDIRNLWDGYDSIHVWEDAAAQTKCGVERTIRLERAIFPSSEQDGTAINHLTLLNVLNLQRSIDSAVSRRPESLTCVSDASGSCISLSPLLHWHSSSDNLIRDPDLFGTLHSDLNFTTANIPIDIDTLLYGHSPHLGFSSDSEFLILTYFFEETDCQGNVGHSAWLDLLAQAASPAQVSTSVATHKLIALQYDPDQSRRRMSFISASLFLAYLVVFMYFSGSLRRMETVHSRFGLAFTGIIEILASTMTSVSVCALWGFRVTMVPWSILPVVIVFVGAENMFSLMDAVVSTSIALSVKERIAVGLARAGTSNTLKVFVYNAILGIIAFFATGAVQQFCIFAVVVLVAHWFLIHTFFVAVLSIDIARLELSELLRQGIASQPLDSTHNGQSIQASKSTTSGGPWSVKAKSLLRGRAARNGSLLLMLAITVGLYWITYSTPMKITDSTPNSTRPRANAPEPAHARLHSHPQLEQQTPSALRLWNLFNPSGDRLLHVRIEPPAMVAFHSTAHTTGDSPIPHVERRRTPDITLRDLAPIMRLSKIILAPIALTTGLLYLLLRYLLKNAELLEAQRHKGEADSASPAVPLAEVEDGVTFSTLFRALSSDVELVDASLDGEVIVCASLNSEVVVWFGKAGDYHSTLDGSVVLTHSENCVGTDQVTSIAVDPEGQYCAVGSDDGAVGLFCLEKDNTPSNVIQPTSIFRRGGHPVSSLFFVERGSLLFVSPGTPTTTIVAAYENGDAVEWDFHNSAISEIQSSHPRSDSKPFFPSQIRGRNSSFRVAFALEDGSLEVMGRGVGANSWATMCILPAGTFQDPVCAVHMERLAIDKDTCDILVTGTYNGKVAFWDGSKGDRIGYLDDVRGPIDRLLLASIPPRPCPQCSEPSVDSFTCAISSGDLVHIYRGSIPFQPNRCSCLSSQLVAPSSSDNFRSKSGSMASSGNSSPVRTRIKLPTVGGPPTNPSAPPYTVSPHSRRSSGVERTDREPNGRARQPSVNIGKDVDTAILEPMSLSQSASPFGESPPKSSWSNFRLKKIAGIACDRGDWDLRNHLVVGIRRRAKSLSPKGGGVRPNSIPRTRLTPSVLDRWEFWTFDPSLQMNWSRASSLSYIVSEAVSSSPQESRRPKSRTSSDVNGSASPDVWSREKPRLPFTRVSPFVTINTTLCVAGFGNTVGLFDLLSHTVRMPETSTKSVLLSAPSNFRKRL